MSGARKPTDAVVVGAGLAGLYAIYALRARGFSVTAVEAGPDVGGTWYWNRYPGARCDVESFDYSYSFSPELDQSWEWTERFPTQPEMLAYIRHVADRFDLRRHIRFATKVVRARYDEPAGCWHLTLDDGSTLTGRFCIMATGMLSVPKAPDLPGLERFTGTVLRTYDWPENPPDLRGRRIASIGTGSSGIQCAPELARQAARLYVLQRTPNFSVPARNAPIPREVAQRMKASYPEYRRRARETYAGVVIEGTDRSALEVTPEEREREYRARWERGGVQFLGAFTDIRTNLAANETAADFVRARILETVRDPEVARRLLPQGHPIGTRRLCVDTDYYEMFNRDNVTLVDLRETPLVEVTETGIRTTARDIELDVIVLATGFDAFTGALTSIDIRGREGDSIAERWANGPRAYLGLSIAGFPNLFVVTGPGSPSVLCNMVRAIEQHVDWIADCMTWLRSRQATSIEATESAQDAWMDHVIGVADTTLYPATDSWYVGSNIPGKPRMFMAYLGGFDDYSRRCDEVAADGYRGFRIGGSPRTVPADDAAGASR